MFYKNSGATNIMSIVFTVVFAAVALVVGIFIVSNTETSLPAITNSVLSSSVTDIAIGSGNAFNFLAMGMFILAALFIIGIVAGAVGKNSE